MIKRLYIHIIGFLLVWALMPLAGCSDRENAPLSEEGMYNTVYLYIDLKMDDDYPASRANRPEDEDWQDGEGNENAINTLHLFWKEQDTWKTVEMNSLNWTDDNTVRIALDKDKYPSLESVEMMLGANLSDEQVNAFLNSNTPYSLKTTTDWANELAPMNYDFSGRNDIAMFCRDVASPTQSSSDSDEEYSISFKLKRLVAKVLVTCKEDGDGYVPLIPETRNSFEGWIKRTDVYYTLNGVNRSTYVMQIVKDGTDYDNNVEDPNPSLKDYVSRYDENNESVYTSLINRYFYYYNVAELMLKDGMYRQTVAQSDSKNYTDGIYCPENTFSPDNLDDDDKTKLEGYNSSWGMITSVSIKAKFTPRTLNVEGGLFDYIGKQSSIDEDIKSEVQRIKDGIIANLENNEIDENGVYEITCSKEKVAKVFLEYSLRYNNFLSQEIQSDKGFPDETYFYHAEQDMYYTYGAAKISYSATENTTKLGNYQPYYDGWGFYYTYIDNRLDKPEDKPYLFYEHGQVERNRYYVININSFSNPGSSSGKANYVEVNTITIPWKNGGSGNITLD